MSYYPRECCAARFRLPEDCMLIWRSPTKRWKRRQVYLRLPVISQANHLTTAQQHYAPPPSAPPPSHTPNAQFYPPPPENQSPGQQASYPPPPTSTSPPYQQQFQPPPSAPQQSQYQFPPEKQPLGPPPDHHEQHYEEYDQPPLDTSNVNNLDHGAPSAGHFVGASATQDDVGTFNGGSYRISHRDTNSILTLQLAVGCPLTAKPGKCYPQSHIGDTNLHRCYDCNDTHNYTKGNGEILHEETDRWRRYGTFDIHRSWRATACPRVSGRYHEYPAHGRRAVVRCPGRLPSLHTWSCERV